MVMKALVTRLRDILDGRGGRPSPMGRQAPDFQLGTRLNDLAALADQFRPDIDDLQDRNPSTYERYKELLEEAE